MSEVMHDAPPPSGVPGQRGKYDWDGIVETLQANPGKWMLVAEGASRGLPSAIKRRRMRALQDPAWEYETRLRNTDVDTGTADLWMSANKKED